MFKRFSHKKSRGNALVEFALASTILMPLLYGTFQFGLAFFYYNELANAVRAGARFASFKTYDSNSTTPSNAYLTAVKNEVVYGNPAGEGSRLVPGLTTANVVVTMEFAGGIPDTVKIRIQNYRVNSIFRQFTLNKPSTAMPYVGRWAPTGL